MCVWSRFVQVRTAWQCQVLVVIVPVTLLESHATCRGCSSHTSGNRSELITLSASLMLQVIPAGTIKRDGGPNDHEFQPQHHIFYGERINDVDDHLPKWSVSIAFLLHTLDCIFTAKPPYQFILSEDAVRSMIEFRNWILLLCAGLVSSTTANG